LFLQSPLFRLFFIIFQAANADLDPDAFVTNLAGSAVPALIKELVLAGSNDFVLK
jgi:hypothetical protein